MGRVRETGLIRMLVSICNGGLLGRGREGRANEKDDIGYWQVAARQRGGVCVEISLGKLCTTLDHGTLRVGIRVSCHISHQKLIPGPNPPGPDPPTPRRQGETVEAA